MLFRSFLANELEQVFANSPSSPQSSDGSKEDTSNAGKRKPIKGDCPICMMEFEEREDLLWCKAACGQNIHKASSVNIDHAPDTNKQAGML